MGVRQNEANSKWMSDFLQIFREVGFSIDKQSKESGVDAEARFVHVLIMLRHKRRCPDDNRHRSQTEKSPKIECGPGQPPGPHRTWVPELLCHR
jgi:hypothetical protein